MEDLPLAEVGRSKPDPAYPLEVRPGYGVVDLPLLVHLAAPPRRDDLDVVHVLVEGVDVGPVDGPLVHLVEGDGVEGNLGVPSDAVNAYLGHEDVEDVGTGDEGLPKASQRRRPGGGPVGQGNLLRRLRARDDPPHRLAPVADGEAPGAVAPDDEVRSGRPGEDVVGALGLRHRGGPDSVVRHLHVLAPLDGEAIRHGERIHDRDSEAEPAPPLHLHVVRGLAVGQVPHLGRAEDLQDPLVVGPGRGQIPGIDGGIVLHDEEAEGPSTDLASGVPVHVGVVPVGSARMVRGELPDVVQAPPRRHRAGDVVGTSGAHDVQAVGVEVGPGPLLGGVAEGEHVPPARHQLDGRPVEGLALVARDGVPVRVPLLAEVQSAAVVDARGAGGARGPVEQARGVDLVHHRDPGRLRRHPPGSDGRGPDQEEEHEGRRVGVEPPRAEGWAAAHAGWLGGGGSGGAGGTSFVRVCVCARADHWSLVTGHWALVTGRWALGAGLWFPFDFDSVAAGGWGIGGSYDGM